jgi:uncharacterized protein with von Willebrand factor type A (vWA) domain
LLPFSVSNAEKIFMQLQRFTEFNPPPQNPFDKFFDIFKELLLHTSGEVEEALDWLRELDKEYNLSTDDYTVEDFINELLEKGYLRETLDNGPENGPGDLEVTAKTTRALKDFTLHQLFGKLKKGTTGHHKTGKMGGASEDFEGTRPFQFGDGVHNLDLMASIRNAQIRSGIEQFSLTDQDLVVREDYQTAQMATVLMIDISHSMILYGEDRITPAKKVAMALAELIARKYPKDTIDLVVFGDDAWPISIGELPFLKVGPYHTNTVAGLELALDLLRRKRHPNKQIFMITDGKPSCIKERDGTYYKNSFGLDEYIVGKCLQMAAQARRLKIPITTFMIARDPYLQEFVRQFTDANKGKALFTGLKGLGNFIFEDYEKNRKRNI